MFGSRSRKHSCCPRPWSRLKWHACHMCKMCTYMYCKRERSVVLNQNNHLRNTFSSFSQVLQVQKKNMRMNNVCLQAAEAYDTDLTYDKLCHNIALQISHRIIEQKYRKTKCPPECQVRLEMGYQNLG